MTKDDLINEIARHLEADAPAKVDIGRVLNALGAVAQGHLGRGVEGEHLTIPGIGTLYKQHRKSRRGRNPRTGEAIEIQEKNIIDFRPNKALKDAIN
jgi:nucleoid DNA-binding protein